MELGLKGRCALVTGGATGIGQAIAVDLSREGVRVAITSRKQEDLERTLDLMAGEATDHRSICCDVSDEGRPGKVVREVTRDFGPIDIVVNNVGDTLGITDPLCPVSDWRRVFRLNLEVAVEVNNLVIPDMKSRSWGRIVNISAGASMENSGPVPYCSSKAALTAYTRCMGRVLARDNIVMSAVLPGVVYTERGHWSKVLAERPEHAQRYLEERTPLRRFGTIHEISPMVVLLCSDLATFCQGSIVPVDGGQAKHYFNIS